MQLALSLSLVAMAAGHRILTSPSSYNSNRVNNNLGCPEQGTYTRVEAKNAKAIPFTWTNDHNGPSWVKVVRSEDEAELEALAVNDPKVVFYQEWTAATGEVAIPLSGAYTAQFGWSSWRNCVGLDIKASCGAYCTDALASCTGADVIYATYEGCFATCATFAQGTGEEDANSLECRFRQLHLEGAPKCPEASLAGASTCVGTYKASHGAALSVFGSAGLTSEALMTLVQAQLTSEGSTATIAGVEEGKGQNEFQVLLTFASATESSAFLSSEGKTYAAAMSVGSDPAVVGVKVEQPEASDKMSAAGRATAGLAALAAAVVFAF